MATVIGVRFKEVGKIYYFDPTDIDFKQNDKVIVETSRGVECGTVALANKEVEEDKIVHPLKKVLRQATKKDLEHLAENKKREVDALKICEEKIKANNLDMKLVDVEYTFDNSKILFYFTADGRVDFRQLVKDLANVFRTRIELRQIGVRDEAKMLGGLGVCGRPCCCNSFLGEFQPVSIKMAKEQGLSLSPVKISGTCGRLMCCLKYEQEAYTDLIKKTPKVGATVKTPEGKGTVVDTALLTGTIKVKLDSTPSEAAPHVYNIKEIRPIGKNFPTENIEEEPLLEDELTDDLAKLEEEEIVAETTQAPQRPNKDERKKNPNHKYQNRKNNGGHNQNHNQGKRPYRKPQQRKPRPNNRNKNFNKEGNKNT